jgi:hypothetical protein
MFFIADREDPEIGEVVTLELGEGRLTSSRVFLGKRKTIRSLIRIGSGHGRHIRRACIQSC